MVSSHLAAKNDLLLVHRITINLLPNSDPHPSPQRIEDRSSVRARKYQRRGVIKIRVSCALCEPEVVEQGKEEGGVEVEEGCYDGEAEIYDSI